MNPQYSRFYTYLKPVVQNKQVKTYTSLVFSILFSIILIIFAIKPALTHITELQKSIDQQKDILLKLKQKSESITIGYENYNKIDEQTKTLLADLLPSKTKITNVINVLENTALTQQAKVSGLQFQPVEVIATESALNKKPLQEEIPFTLTSQADFQAASKLLDALSHSQRLFRVDSVNFNKQEDTSQTLVVINGRAYLVR